MSKLSAVKNFCLVYLINETDLNTFDIRTLDLQDLDIDDMEKFN